MPKCKMLTKHGQLEKRGMGNGNGYLHKSCMGRDKASACRHLVLKLAFPEMTQGSCKLIFFTKDGLQILPTIWPCDTAFNTLGLVSDMGTKAHLTI